MCQYIGVSSLRKVKIEEDVIVYFVIVLNLRGNLNFNIDVIIVQRVSVVS